MKPPWNRQPANGLKTSMIVVLDTCALLWLTLAPEELSPAAHKVLAAGSELQVCSISIWEIGVKVKRKKLDLGVSYSEYVKRLSISSDLNILPVDHQLWAHSVLLDWDHRDPADRVIVSLAERSQARLISDDREIRAFYPNTIG